MKKGLICTLVLLALGIFVLQNANAGCADTGASCGSTNYTCAAGVAINYSENSTQYSWLCRGTY